jgi:hypothetical protein
MAALQHLPDLLVSDHSAAVRGTAVAMLAALPPGPAPRFAIDRMRLPLLSNDSLRVQAGIRAVRALATSLQPDGPGLAHSVVQAHHDILSRLAAPDMATLAAAAELARVSPGFSGRALPGLAEVALNSSREVALRLAAAAALGGMGHGPADVAHGAIEALRGAITIEGQDLSVVSASVRSVALIARDCPPVAAAALGFLASIAQPAEGARVSVVALEALADGIAGAPAALSAARATELARGLAPWLTPSAEEPLMVGALAVLGSLAGAQANEPGLGLSLPKETITASQLLLAHPHRQVRLGAARVVLETSSSSSDAVRSVLSMVHSDPPTLLELAALLARLSDGSSELAALVCAGSLRLASAPRVSGRIAAAAAALAARASTRAAVPPAPDLAGFVKSLVASAPPSAHLPGLVVALSLLERIPHSASMRSLREAAESALKQASSDLSSGWARYRLGCQALARGAPHLALHLLPNPSSSSSSSSSAVLLSRDDMSLWLSSLSSLAAVEAEAASGKDRSGELSRVRSALRTLISPACPVIFQCRWVKAHEALAQARESVASVAEDSSLWGPLGSPSPPELARRSAAFALHRCAASLDSAALGYRAMAYADPTMKRLCHERILEWARAVASLARVMRAIATVAEGGERVAPHDGASAAVAAPAPWASAGSSRVLLASAACLDHLSSHSSSPLPALRLALRSLDEATWLYPGRFFRISAPDVVLLSCQPATRPDQPLVMEHGQALALRVSGVLQNHDGRGSRFASVCLSVTVMSVSSPGSSEPRDQHVHECVTPIAPSGAFEAVCLVRFHHPDFHLLQTRAALIDKSGCKWASSLNDNAAVQHAKVLRF